MINRFKTYWTNHLFNSTFSNRNSESNVLKVLVAVLQSHARVLEIDNTILIFPSNQAKCMEILNSMHFESSTVSFKKANMRVPSLIKRSYASHLYSLEHNIYLILLPETKLQTALASMRILKSLQLDTDVDSFVSVFTILDEPNN